MIQRFRRCGHAPGTLSPEDRAVVDQFRELLAAMREPQPWTPGCSQDVAVHVGPHLERVHPRPGDDQGPDLIAVSLVHPDAPHAWTHRHGRELGYNGRGWLRCKTTAILGIWQPAYAMFTHAAADQTLPDDVGMDPAHYAVSVEAHHTDGTSSALLRLGPYFQTGHASRDADLLTAWMTLVDRAGNIPSGCTVTATTAPFNVSDHTAYRDPAGAIPTELLADALREARA